MLKEQCKKRTELEKKISKMQEQINFVVVGVIPVLKDVVMENNLEFVLPFMKLVWKEQKKYLPINPKGKKYHPMIIGFCLSVAAKSPSAYGKMGNSNILILPRRGILRDYKNPIRPHAGFNRSVIDELIKITSLLKGYQRCVVLSFDEIKIQDNLVFDKYTGYLIGYVNLEDIELNYGTFQAVNELATHALVYYVQVIASDLKFSLAYFSTKGVTAYQIIPTFLEAVAIVELTCKLQVIATVNDGASPNRNFYWMHDQMSNTDNSCVWYSTINLYSPGQYICFFADPPHLMKTTRNCMVHSVMSIHLFNKSNKLTTK